ncbi:hypothetical protein [Bradyrhizobium sp. URHD0069]|uniref:hypothetical protein n=1 Tax=Bradyrhizobium sp. URHD0069 TaxID=1380355 RepID=UPI003528DB8F
MFETLLHSATGQLRRLLADASRRRQAIRRWNRELGSNEAEVRGFRLLREWLSPEQLAQYDAHNYFDVTGCHSGRRYRIRHGTATNIYELDNFGRPRTGWCFVPRDRLVPGDVMLAQKIALETDESAALRVAKSFPPTWLG